MTSDSSDSIHLPVAEIQVMSKSKMSAWNIISNLLNKVWGALSLYIFSTLYVRIIGVEGYAIIGLYALTLAVLSFVDSGVSSAVNREFSKRVDNLYQHKLLLLFEKAYGVACMLIFIIGLIAAPAIVDHFLFQERAFSQNEELILQLRLIIAAVLIQLYANLYNGALMGAQKQVWMNVAQFGWSLVRNTSGVLVLIMNNESLTAFFVCQVAVNIAYVVMLRFKTISMLGNKEGVVPLGFKEVDNSVWRYLQAMMLMSILVVPAMQTDKIVVSHFFSPAIFGVYSLISLLSQTPAFIAAPVSLALFPKMVNNYFVRDDAGFRNEFELNFLLIANLAIVVSCILIFFGADLCLLWFKQQSLAPDQIGAVMSFLTLGFLFQALQHPHYYALMAAGKTKLSIWQNVVETIFIVFGSLVMVKKFGVVGASIPFAIVKFAGFLFLSISVPRVLPEIKHVSIAAVILKISAMAIACSGLAFALFFKWSIGQWQPVVFAMASFFFTLFMGYKLYGPRIRLLGGW